MTFSKLILLVGPLLHSLHCLCVQKAEAAVLQRLEGHLGYVTSLLWVGGGGLLVSASWDHTVKVRVTMIPSPIPWCRCGTRGGASSCTVWTATASPSPGTVLYCAVLYCTILYRHQGLALPRDRLPRLQRPGRGGQLLGREGDSITILYSSSKAALLPRTGATWRHTRVRAGSCWPSGTMPGTR